MSQYISRGEVLAPVPVLQSSIDLKRRTLSLSAWVSRALISRHVHGRADELNLTLTHEAERERLAWTGGLAYYVFPGGQRPFSFRDHTSPELFLSVTPHWRLQPTLSAYYDLNLGGGLYSDLAAEYVLDRMPLSLGAELGYNYNQADASAGLSHILLHMRGTRLLKSFALEPSVAFVHIFERFGSAGNYVLIGLSLTY